MALKLRKKVPPPPGCPMSACMSLLGGVWTPEIIWNVSEGPRRFSELRRAMPAISAKVLSGRLKDLEERGVLSRAVLPTTPPSVEYALTDLGEDLIPAIRAIVEVGSKLHLRITSEAASCAAQGEPLPEKIVPLPKVETANVRLWAST
ncbi:winged helix-turn-helix transcriptional regulator [uncultured Enterovirga sp.]|uniref:winged helix-turn-helix transcriptional regulator n=1 Tax=uncultured Enterovirga sp. TaxID=2026352 RepID=UPI0035CA021B